MPYRSQSGHYAEVSQVTVCSHCGAPITELAIEFTFGTGEVRAGGVTATLRPMHMRILECLVDAYPRALSRPALFAELYQDEDEPPGYNVLNVTVGQMRKAIAAARLPFSIISVTGGDAEGLLLAPEMHGDFIRQVA